MEFLAIAEELDQIISDAVPKAQKLQKYGGTLYTLHPDEKEGQFCGVFIFKKHVQLSFSRGAELKDPASILGGSGKMRRHVNIKSAEEIETRKLVPLLKAASKL